MLSNIIMLILFLFMAVAFAYLAYIQYGDMYVNDGKLVKVAFVLDVICVILWVINAIIRIFMILA